MVDFLTTVLLAIIIFVPTCYALSKVFVLSDQAKNSFEDFATEIQKFSKDENALKTTGVVILDKETSLVLYNQPEQKLAFFQEGSFSWKAYYLPYPQDKCEATPCLCLCRKFEFDSASQFEDEPPFHQHLLLFPALPPEAFNGDDYAASCLLQECLAFPQVQFKQGFTVFRGENDVRRVVLNIHKEADAQNKVQLVASKP